MKTARQQIRDVLNLEVGMTIAQVVARTKLDSKTVSTSLSAMVHRTGEVAYSKVAGCSYGTYRLTSFATGVQDVSLKLAQLRTHRDHLAKFGITLIDKIIMDYENMLAE